MELCLPNHYVCWRKLQRSYQITTWYRYFNHCMKVARKRVINSSIECVSNAWVPNLSYRHIDLATNQYLHHAQHPNLIAWQTPPSSYLYHGTSSEWFRFVSEYLVRKKYWICTLPRQLEHLVKFHYEHFSIVTINYVRKISNNSLRFCRLKNCIRIRNHMYSRK